GLVSRNSHTYNEAEKQDQPPRHRLPSSNKRKFLRGRFTSVCSVTQPSNSIYSATPHYVETSGKGNTYLLKSPSVPTNHARRFIPRFVGVDGTGGRRRCSLDLGVFRVWEWSTRCHGVTVRT